MSAEDGITVFRGRLGKAKAATGAATGLRLAKKMLRSAGKPASTRGKGAGSSASTRTASQRVVVRARIVKLKAGSARAQIARHLGYVERDGSGEDGTPGRAFNDVGSMGDKELDDFADRGAEAPHQFRIIVSPENGSDMDLETATRDLVRRMERDLGTRLDYAAVVHYDTDQHHVHLLINGRDERGGDLVIARDYLSHGLRERAMDIATDQLGYRTPDMHKEMGAQVERMKYTALDRSLERASVDGQIDLRILPKGEFARSMRSVQLSRLSKLESIGIATEIRPGVWRLAEDSKERLLAISDTERARDRAAPHLDHPMQQIVVLNPNHKDMKSVSGTIVGAGLSDELGDTRYVVLQLDDGRIGYTTLSHAHESSGRPVVGDRVDVSRNEYKATGTADANLVKFRDSNGIYSESDHLRHVVSDVEKGKLLPNNITPEEFIGAHISRAKALASRGFASESNAGFVIPIDLQARLEANQEKNRGGGVINVRVRGSRQQLLMNQGRGSGWIDDHLERHGSQLPTTRTAHQRNLQAVLNQRSDYLVKRGLATGKPFAFIPGARKTLDVVAMRELGREIAEVNGMRQVSLEDAKAFRGTVISAHRIGNYDAVVVQNATDNTLTVVQAKGLTIKDVGRDLALDYTKSQVRFAFTKDKTMGLSL